jgi:hypothetical protein
LCCLFSFEGTKLEETTPPSFSLLCRNTDGKKQLSFSLSSSIHTHTNNNNKRQQTSSLFFFFFGTCERQTYYIIATRNSRKQHDFDDIMILMIFFFPHEIVFEEECFLGGKSFEFSLDLSGKKQEHNNWSCEENKFRIPKSIEKSHFVIISF